MLGCGLNHLCADISGVPGTGKTATVQILAQNLQRKQHSTNKFRYLEINGLKIPDPGAAYTLLWEAVSNPQTLTGKGKGKAAPTQTRTSSKEALKRLTRYFEEEQSEEELPLVVLMDELDQLMTTKQDVVYNFFNWPTFPGSRLVVIAVANTHDMPERAMSGKVRSRLGEPSELKYVTDRSLTSMWRRYDPHQLQAVPAQRAAHDRLRKAEDCQGD